MPAEETALRFLRAAAAAQFHKNGSFEPLLWTSAIAAMRISTGAPQAVLRKEKVSTGRIATGDRFLSGRESKTALYDTVHASAAEVEGGAVAQVAALSGVPFAVIRAISNLADGAAAGPYDILEQQAANDSAAAGKQAPRLPTGKE